MDFFGRADLFSLTFSFLSDASSDLSLINAYAFVKKLLFSQVNIFFDNIKTKAGAQGK